jgi:hypothetical protein
MVCAGIISFLRRFEVYKRCSLCLILVCYHFLISTIPRDLACRRCCEGSFHQIGRISAEHLRYSTLRSCNMSTCWPAVFRWLFLAPKAGSTICDLCPRSMYFFEHRGVERICQTVMIVSDAAKPAFKLAPSKPLRNNSRGSNRSREQIRFGPDSHRKRMNTSLYGIVRRSDVFVETWSQDYEMMGFRRDKRACSEYHIPTAPHTKFPLPL